MTSSFGTVIGTPRDEIPELPVGNYAQTEPDLTKSVNEQIDKNQQDLSRFYDSLAEIERARANDFMSKLEGLEGLLGKAAEFKKLRDADREAREQIKFFSGVNKDTLQKVLTFQEQTKDLVEAEKLEALRELAEEDPVAADFYNLTLFETTDETNWKDLKYQFNTLGTSSFLTLLEDKFFLQSSTLADATNIADESIATLITKLYLDLDNAGFDIDSREVQQYVLRQLLPKLVKQKETSLNNWTSVKERYNLTQIESKNELKVVEYLTGKGLINSSDANEANLFNFLIKNNSNITNPKEAAQKFLEIITRPDVQNQLDLGAITYFLDEATFYDSATGETVVGWRNTNFSTTNAVTTALGNIEERLAVTRSDAYQAIETKYDELVRNKKIELGVDELPIGVLLELQAGFQADLKAEGLSWDAGLPSFLMGDETVDSNNYPYKVQEKARITVNSVDFETRWQNKLVDEPLPLTANSQIGLARAELEALISADLAEDINLSTQELLEKHFQTVMDKLVAGDYAEQVKSDPLRPLTPTMLDKEINILNANKDQFMNNSEVNSVYEKRALDLFIENYVQGGFDPNNIPTYLVEMARVAGYRSPLDYVIARLDALEVYDKDSKKFIPENPEDQFNLSEDELDFLFVNANTTKNLILLSEKGELDVDSAKETLLKLRINDTVDFIGTGRDFLRRTGNFIWPGTEVKTIEDVYILAKSGKYDNFGLYGFSSEELIELIDSGIVSRDANFNDENIQDYLALGLMRIQANKSNSIIGANTEALSWNRLVNLNEADQELIIRYFPSLRDMPMNQFQNLLPEVSNAILSDVETRQKEIDDTLIRMRERQEEFEKEFPNVDWTDPNNSYRKIFEKRYMQGLDINTWALSPLNTDNSSD